MTDYTRERVEEFLERHLPHMDQDDETFMNLEHLSLDFLSRNVAMFRRMLGGINFLSCLTRHPDLSWPIFKKMIRNRLDSKVLPTLEIFCRRVRCLTDQDLQDLFAHFAHARSAILKNLLENPYLSPEMYVSLVQMDDLDNHEKSIHIARNQRYAEQYFNSGALVMSSDVRESLHCNRGIGSQFYQKNEDLASERHGELHFIYRGDCCDPVWAYKKYPNLRRVILKNNRRITIETAKQFVACDGNLTILTKNITLPLKQLYDNFPERHEEIRSASIARSNLPERYVLEYVSALPSKERYRALVTVMENNKTLSEDFFLTPWVFDTLFTHNTFCLNFWNDMLNFFRRHAKIITPKLLEPLYPLILDRVYGDVSCPIFASCRDLRLTPEYTQEVLIPFFLRLAEKTNANSRLTYACMLCLQGSTIEYAESHWDKFSQITANDLLSSALFPRYRRSTTLKARRLECERKIYRIIAEKTIDETTGQIFDILYDHTGTCF